MPIYLLTMALQYAAILDSFGHEPSSLTPVLPLAWSRYLLMIGRMREITMFLSYPFLARLSGDPMQRTPKTPPSFCSTKSTIRFRPFKANPGRGQMDQYLR